MAFYTDDTAKTIKVAQTPRGFRKKLLFFAVYLLKLRIGDKF
jgi:hypothetical protein